MGSKKSVRAPRGAGLHPGIITSPAASPHHFIFHCVCVSVCAVNRLTPSNCQKHDHFDTYPQPWQHFYEAVDLESGPEANTCLVTCSQGSTVIFNDSIMLIKQRSEVFI